MRRGVSVSALAVLLFTILPNIEAWTPRSFPQAEQRKAATVSGEVLIKNKEAGALAEWSKPSKPLTIVIKGCKCEDCPPDLKKKPCWCCPPQIRTDANGEFDLSLPPGTYMFHVEGYSSGDIQVKLEPGQKKDVKMKVE
jgi:hypothetical protein